MKKKIILVLVAAVFLIVAMTSCTQSHLTSVLTINSAEGAGTRTFVVTIERDHMLEQAKQDIEDFNSRFFANGFEETREWAEGELPAGFTIAFAEQTDYWVYTISMTFSSIADYNAKIEALMDPADYLDYITEPATITTEEVEGGHNVTFKEVAVTSKYSILGLVRSWTLSDEYADRADWGEGNIAADAHYKVTDVKIVVGDGSEDYVEEYDGEYVTATGFVAAGAVADPTPTSTPTAQPGDAGVLAAVALLLVSAGAVFFSKKFARN